MLFFDFHFKSIDNYNFYRSKIMQKNLMFIQIHAPEIPQEPLQSSTSWVTIQTEDHSEPVKIPQHHTKNKLPVIKRQAQAKKKPLVMKRKESKLKQCRICLQNSQQKSKLVKACRCTGSIEYAHSHCLIQWIKRKILANSDTKVACQLCHTQFNYKLTNRKKLDCDQLKKHYSKQKKDILCFALVYCSLFLLFVTMIVVVTVSIQSKSLFLYSFLTAEGEGPALFLSFMIVYFIGLILAAILFISQYLIREEIAISEVMRYQEFKFAGLVKNHKIYFDR